MGTVYAEITLKNGGDVINVGRGIISDKEVRILTVTVLVDTGASTLVINEDICHQLGLSIVETRVATLAGGVRAECKISEPVQIHWKDRQVACNALVLPEGDALLGVIPLEFMDLMVDPVRHELTGAHGDQIVTLVM